MQQSGRRLLGILALLALMLGLGIWKWSGRPAPVALNHPPVVPQQPAPVRSEPGPAMGKAREIVAAAAPASPQPLARVHGFVLGPDGMPVAGAVVESQPRAAQLATSGENGEFWFSLARDSLVVGARQGELQSPPAIAHAGAGDQELLLTLKAAGTLLVQVSAAITRKPVVGARLQLSQNGAAIGSELRSDERGQARFVLTRGGHLLVRAAADGFGATARGFWASAASAGEQQITLAMPPEFSAHGRVQSGDGKPAARVAVTALDISSNQPSVTVQTDVDGRYRIGQLYSGVFRFEALDPVLGHAISGPIELQRETLVNLVLDTEPSLSGVVSDEGGQPVPSAEVVLWPQAEGAYRFPEQRKQLADAGGNFRFVGLPTARAKLAARLGEAA